MLYRPAQIAIAGLVVWIAIWLVLPVDVRLPMRWNTVGFIALGYSCFIGGCLWAQRANDYETLDSLIADDPWRQPLLSGLFWGSYGLGALAMALRLFDRIVVRGLDYTADAGEVRETLAATDFSFASVISSVILPLCFLPFILLLASRWERGHLRKLLLSLFLAILPMAESLLQASRSVMLLTAMMIFFAICLLKFGGKIFGRKTLLPLVAGIAVFTVVSGAIFSGRVEAYGRTVEETVFSSVYAEAFTPKPIARQALRSGGPLSQAVAETVLPLGMYYVSGFYEFDMANNRPDEQLFAFGSYIFYPYSRVIGLVFGQENIRGLNEEGIIFRTGTFTSFFGPLWVDFGYFMFPLLVFLGYSAQRMAVLVAQGYVNVVPIYLLFIVAIFYIPVFNFLTNGFGFFMFNAYILFYLFSSFGINKPTIDDGEVKPSGTWSVAQAK